MKKLAVLAFLMLIATAGSAQEKRLSSAPQSFRSFYVAFARAAERNDKKNVAGMTRFPFKYGYDAGDEGTYSRATFIQNFNKIFADLDAFLPKRDPLFGRDGTNYYVSTDGAAHLGFAKSGQTYKFVSFIVEP